MLRQPYVVSQFTLIHFSRLPVPRAFGHARSRVTTLNRVLARQEKEIIETALEECYGQVSGPSGAATKLALLPLPALP